MDEQVVRHIYEPSRQEVRVKLVKNTKAYGWEISVSREDSEEALSEIKSLDESLRQIYGEGAEEVGKKPDQSPANGRPNMSSESKSVPRQQEKSASVQANPISESQVKEVIRLTQLLDMNEEKLNQWVREGYGCTLEELTYDQGTEAICLLHQKHQENAL